MSGLSKKFLSGLVEELRRGDTVAIALTGSYARGDSGRYSDVDLWHFVHETPREESERYKLRYREDHLISISTTTIEAKRAELAAPEEAIWTVPGLRQARVLLDRDGALDSLLQEGGDFTWKPLQPAADAYASYTVMGYAEEVHKVLGGLLTKDESALAAGTLGLFLGVTRAVAVQRGILIESDNSYLRQVQNDVGLDSSWTHWHQLTVGMASKAQDPSSVETRAVAGLRLYERTVDLTRHILRPQHLDVVDRTVAAIQASEALSST